MKPLTEFGSRLITLHTGQQGLRAGVHCVAKDVPGDEPMMDFVASDNTVDRYNEVIDQSGWQLENFQRNPVIPDCHDYSSISRVLGKAVKCEVVDGMLRNRVEFCLDNPLGVMAWKMAKTGFIKSQSVGFIPLEWVNGTKDEPDRTYKKCELLEISLVVVPANPGATVGLALRSGALEKSDIRSVIDLLKQFCSEKEVPDNDAGATVARGHFARLLQSTKSLSDLLKG